MLARSGGIDVDVTLPSDREIAFTCIFKRPRHLLFEAWTEPKHLRQWWGCPGSELTLCEIDLRVGGAWQIVMRMKDESEHSFRGVYSEIVRNERLVYTECYDAPKLGCPEWLTTVTFKDLGDSVQVSHTIRHRSREARDGHLQSGMEAGTLQMFEHLDQHAERMAGSSLHDRA